MFILCCKKKCEYLYCKKQTKELRGDTNMLKNIEEFCSLFYSSIRIPLSLFDSGGNCIYSWPMKEFTPLSLPHAIAPTRNPDLYISPSHGFYGILLLPENHGFLFLGPAYNTPITPDILHGFFKENAISNELHEQIASVFYATPITSYLNFVHHLELLFYGIMGERIDLVHIFDTEIDSKRKDLHQEFITKHTEQKESQTYHDSYLWEKEFYSLIQNGNPASLKTFFQNSQQLPANEGTMATSPLRNSKNLFIGTVTKIGMLAAIPGGLDVEQTYGLIDMYTKECERLTTIEDINALHTRMAFDFCERMSEVQIPEGLSNEVYQCMCYIRNHTNTSFSITDVANEVHRSTSYISGRFQQELGINIGAYIRRCKLEEAKSLLIYSNKSLSEISSYLCFSSQSYFQNVFKKKYGMTPMRYRKEKSGEAFFKN